MDRAGVPRRVSGMAEKKRNLELPEGIDRLLEEERATGISMTATLSAAIYWYFNRLDAGQREQARMDCATWLDEGAARVAQMQGELGKALQNARERGSRRSPRGSAGGK